MPPTEGVLFDYGRTLVTFTPYPREQLLAVIRRFRPRIEGAIGAPAPEAESILHDVLHPLEALVASTSEDEVDYTDVYRDAWLRAGMELPDDLLHEILDAEQLVWDGSVRVDPEAPRVLGWLGEHAIKRGVCSNAPFPPDMMRRQMRSNGIAGMVDQIVLSSELGRRKPAREIYQAALDAIGTAPAKTLFVGDRVREDYDGPRALGVRAVIVTAHAEEPPPDGVSAIKNLSELLHLL